MRDAQGSGGVYHGAPDDPQRVRALQLQLCRSGESPGRIDGRFGPQTEAAVRRFQRRQGMVVDGVVGPLTAVRLRRPRALVLPARGSYLKGAVQPTEDHPPAGETNAMAEVISLGAHRRERRDRRGRGPGTRSVTFSFDLASPFTYLAVERVQRLQPRARWEPAYAEALRRHDPWSDPVSRAAAEARAAALRVPLVWPERPPASACAPMRAAAYAAICGRAAPFAIAAARLAFCGGFDLDDLELVAEASAAAGLPLDACVDAANDARRDAGLQAAGNRLLAAGADRLPVLAVDGVLFAGERHIAEAGTG